MSSVETDSESDIETEIQDLKQLTAALIGDEPSTSSSTLAYSMATTSLVNCSTANPRELSQIETALALNKMCDEQIQQLENNLIIKLRECKQKLDIIRSSDKNVNKHIKLESFRYLNCGKPYFKDKSNFTPPNNEDTLTMAKSEMYDFSYLSSVQGWTRKDKSALVELLYKMTRDKVKDEINLKISKLKRESKGKSSSEIDKEIAALNRKLKALNKTPLKNLALPINEEYDWDYVAHKLNKNHSPEEYQAMWKLFLHPSLNKNRWSKNEHLQLQKIANENKYQNWDQIAEQLQNNKSSYQCFVYFRTNMSTTFTGQKWTKEEEEYLKRLIDYYREGSYIPWGKVASVMDNRTKIQIYNKYLRLTEERKGRFLPEEDTVILSFVDSYGPNFKKMTRFLPGRSMSQLRVRYQILARKRISSTWTVEEDRKLITLASNNNSPGIYSSLADYFPEKNRTNIRSRYLTLIKWIKSHPNVDISKAPRRAARRLGHGQASDNLNCAIEKLKVRMQTEVDTRKSKKITSDSPEDVIEDAIIVTLANENIKEEENKKSQQFEDNQTTLRDSTDISSNSLNVTNLRKLLILLKSKLNKKLLEKSEYGQNYPELINVQNEISSVRIKSYSKKDREKPSININQSPDIYGTKKLGVLQYVLPPNYATITGCKKLMASIWSEKKNVTNDLNLNVLMRQNKYLRKQVFLLSERINSLFLWPLILSNHQPDTSKTEEPVLPNFKELFPKISLPSRGYGIAIPDVKSEIINDKIDLEESVSDGDTLIKMFINSEIAQGFSMDDT